MNFKVAFAASIIVSLMTGSTRGAEPESDLEGRIAALEKRLQQINTQVDKLDSSAVKISQLQGEKPKLVDIDSGADHGADHGAHLGESTGDHSILKGSDDVADADPRHTKQEITANKVATDREFALADDDIEGLLLPGEEEPIDEAADVADDDVADDDPDADDPDGLLAGFADELDAPQTARDQAQPSAKHAQPIGGSLDQRVVRIEQLTVEIEERLKKLNVLAEQKASGNDASDNVSPITAARPTGPAEIGSDNDLKVDTALVIVNNWTGNTHQITINEKPYQLEPGRNQFEVEYGSVTTRMPNDTVETLWELSHWRPVGDSQQLVLDLKN